MTAIEDVTAAVCRHGDADARAVVHELVHEFGPESAAALLLGDLMPGLEHRSLSRRLRRLLDDRGGSVTHAHLTRYLAELLGEPQHLVRDVVLEDVAAGVLHLTWADPADDLRHTLEVVR